MKRPRGRFALSTVYAVNSYRSLAGNLRQLVDFQFEVFTVSEAVSLPYQQSEMQKSSEFCSKTPQKSNEMRNIDRCFQLSG